MTPRVFYAVAAIAAIAAPALAFGGAPIGDWRFGSPIRLQGEPELLRPHRP